MKAPFFCCESLTLSLNDAGNKGFSIIPSSYLDTYTCFLQARNKDYIDKDKPGFSVGQTNISYCPWCGCKLSEVVKKYEDEISELARENSYLLL